MSMYYSLKQLLRISHHSTWISSCLFQRSGLLIMDEVCGTRDGLTNLSFNWLPCECRYSSLCLDEVLSAYSTDHWWCFERFPANTICSRLCRSPVGIYSYNGSVSLNAELLYRISTFFVGYYPIEALLASTVECFYHQSCMMELDRHMLKPFGSSFDFSSLNASRNLPNETVDRWSSNLCFSAYFQACAPLSCVSEYKRRNDYLTIITTTIGIFGGLWLAYKVVIVIILRLIEKFMRRFTWMIIRQSVKDLFVCVDERKITDRLHFVLLIVILGVLYSFTAFTPDNNSTRIHSL